MAGVAPVAAAGQGPPVPFARLAAELRICMKESQVFQPGFAGDLGDKGTQLIADAKEGLDAACRGVEIRRKDEEGVCDGRMATGAVFDGLRLAKRRIEVALAEAQDATLLTASGLSALKELLASVDRFIASAQRDLGATASLKSAGEALRVSGLDGIGSLIAALDSAAKKAAGITLGIEDPAAISVAKRVRLLDTETRPLLDQIAPDTTKDWSQIQDGEVLWETRMVNVSDVVTQALRDSRAEAGAWAVCKDIAQEIRKVSEEVANVFDEVGTKLADGNVSVGAECLRIVREATVSSNDDFDEQSALLIRDAQKWLRDGVGAVNILLDAADNRIKGQSDVSFILKEAANCLTQSAAVAGAGAAFQRGWAKLDGLPAQAREEVGAILDQVNKEVGQVIGMTWAGGTAPPPVVQEEPVKESAPVPETQKSPEKKPAPEQAESKGCCILL
eukprot:gnl/MRDRNA2_/MRDRNA2_70495_c0_seq1.p1 gnl/MRDRNA2_/MRDRNA2_70495_c0~~gnl/MRDRNA2_/MRDRNA2_70495_c0_seq1.p1  ORF type:complete len:447 (-),score=105.04 gnl/MRDRNA2_/MRDRNA2_70495_c0_seq1:78-1418(-)